MTLPSVDVAARLFWIGFADAAVRAVAFAAVVVVVLAAVRPKRAAMRLATWTVVIGVALTMPALTHILPAIPVPVPQTWRGAVPLPPAGTLAPIAVLEQRDPPAGAISPGRVIPVDPISSPEPERASASLSWPAVAALIYLAGALVLLLRMAVGWRTIARFEREARPINDARLRARLEHLARTLGVPASRLPRLRETPALFVPMTMGVIRSAILLPSTWRTWDADTLDAVLVHELSHIARRDGLTQALSLTCRALYWCSPLSWWLHRHAIELGEQASDEAVLATGLDRASYAGALMRFFTAIQGRPRRAAWTMAMASGASVERRVERVLGWTAHPGTSMVAGTATAIVCASAAAISAAARPAAPIERPRPSAAVSLTNWRVTPFQQSLSLIAPPPVTPPYQPQPAPGGAAPATAPQVMVVLFDLDDASEPDRARAVQNIERNIEAARTRFSVGLDQARVWRIATVSSSVDVIQDFTGDTAKLSAALATVARRTPAAGIDVHARYLAARAQCDALARMPNDGAFFQDIGPDFQAAIRVGQIRPWSLDSRVRGLWHIVAGANVPEVERTALKASCLQQGIVFDDSVTKGAGAAAPQSQAPAPVPPGRRLIAMFFDVNLLPLGDLARAVDAATAFVDRDMQATDQVSVVMMSKTLETIQTFTNDGSLIKSALGRVRVTKPDTADRSSLSAVTTVCGDMDVVRSRNGTLANQGLTAGPFTAPQLLYYSTGVDRGILGPLTVQSMRAACAAAGVSFYVPGIVLPGARDLSRTLAMTADVIFAEASIRQQSPRNSPAPGVTLSLVPHQAGAPVTITRSTSGLDSGYASAVVRNDSTKPIRAITLAAVVRDGAPVMPSPSVLTASSAAVTIAPGGSVEMATRLIDGDQLIALARHGAAAELGVVEVEFADGSKWTYDLKAKGQFER